MEAVSLMKAKQEPRVGLWAMLREDVANMFQRDPAGVTRRAFWPTSPGSGPASISIRERPSGGVSSATRKKCASRRLPLKIAAGT